MLFGSVAFVFAFLPITLIGFYVLATRSARTPAMLWLLACSVFFYGYWRLDYLPILLGSVLINYPIARLIQNSTPNSAIGRGYLILGLVFNLGLLGYFKYLDFAIETVNAISGSSWSTLGLMLPLAISFFTFQQVTYLVDSYRGKVTTGTLLNYAVFVTFFPQLIAGPIVHHKEMMPQFAGRFIGVLRWKNLLLGLSIFGIGLFKKMVLADNLAPYADAGYAAHTELTTLDAWVTTLAYTFQLYFDFSGYSDMAIGAARLFGIRLPLNFFSPYKARSIQEFWRRWHITLSRFLRDYIYIPLGGNRGSASRTGLNLVLTFLLGGIWHGAGWTFIIWGLIHGCALVIARIFSRLGLVLPAIAGWALTFFVVHIAWILFRAEDLAQAGHVLQTLFGLLPHPAGAPSHVVIENEGDASKLIIICALVAFLLPNTDQFCRNIQKPWKTCFAAILLGLGCVAILVSRSQVFLYFNF